VGNRRNCFDLSIRSQGELFYGIAAAGEPFQKGNQMLTTIVVDWDCWLTVDGMKKRIKCWRLALMNFSWVALA
jgi:hypothetical protein